MPLNSIFSPLHKGIYVFEIKRILSVFIVLSISYNSNADSTELNWVGCDVSKTAYVTDLTTAYQQKTGIHINLRAGNAASGIREVKNGVADLGGTSRYLLPNDPREAGVELLPIAWDALTVIVHPQNPLESISLDQAKAIFTGHIQNWAELGGADQIIEVLALDAINAEEGRALRKLLLSDINRKIIVSRVFDSSEALEQALMQNPNAVAITGISTARLGDYKMVALDGITPSIENIKTGDYSLYRPLYLAYDPDSPHIDIVRDFIEFVQSKSGRDMMRANGVVPYREALSLVMKQVRENEASYPLTVDKL